MADETTHKIIPLTLKVPNQGKSNVKLVRVPMRGLGDVIAKVTSAVGIKPCVGCGKRQEVLNSWFPFKGNK